MHFSNYFVFKELFSIFPILHKTHEKETQKSASINVCRDFEMQRSVFLESEQLHKRLSNMLQDGLSALHLSLDSFKMMTSFYKSQKTSTQRPKIHSLTVPCSRASTASFPIQGQQCSDSFWDLSPSQAGRRTVISEEEQQQGFIWKKCCPMLP